MIKTLLAFFFLGPVFLLGQSAFDGTWRIDPHSMQYIGTMKFWLQDANWGCDTCVPKEAAKADGKDHNISGAPSYDKINVREVDDRTVEALNKKGNKIVGTNKLTASEDGKTLTVEWTQVSESGEKSSGKYNCERIGNATPGAHKISGIWQPGKMENASANVMTVTYKATGEGMSMTDPWGESYEAKFDGNDYPFKGNPNITTMSLRKIEANTFEEMAKRNGKLVSVTRMTVSPDGKTLTSNMDDKLQGMTIKWMAEKE